ncbi:MAG: inositol monophosphatase family protein, partial [Beijerinckiaceae bacterium]
MQADEALTALRRAAVAAGEAAATFFHEGAQTSARVSYKAGDSPVSEADLAANATLERLLRAAFPAAGWISEETERDPAGPGVDQLIIVDPIDGTRAFIAGDPQWSVSVALVAAGRPVAGVVHAPALGLTYEAAAGGGARLNGAPIACSGLPSMAGALVAGPRPLLDRMERATGGTFRRAPRTPSLALRLARAADGTFDCAVASEGSHDWDIAAADVILAEAGAALL